MHGPLAYPRDLVQAVIMKTILLLPVITGGLLALGFYPSIVRASWTNNNPSTASKCQSADIDDAGTLIIDCKVSNIATAFITVNGNQAALASLSNGPCFAQELNDVAAGQEKAIGTCLDSNNVWQAVAWSASNPSAVTQLMPYSGILGLVGAGVATHSSGVNIQGTAIGVSVDGLNNRLPVAWIQNSATATSFNPPLLSLITNCVPAAINDAATPSVIGNCPAGSGGSGKNNAVLWTSLASSYQVLPVPIGASYCRAKQINLSGQIIGDCIFGLGVIQAVQWGAGGTGPTVLSTVNGATVSQSFSARQSDTGEVAVDYVGSGSDAGLIEAAIWSPSGGNTGANAIALPTGGDHGVIGEIGNDGKAVGYFETATGDTHPMHIDAGSFIAVDDGSPLGGPNATATQLSKSGVWEAGAGENSSEHLQAIAQSVP